MGCPDLVGAVVVGWTLAVFLAGVLLYFAYLRFAKNRCSIAQCFDTLKRGLHGVRSEGAVFISYSHRNTQFAEQIELSLVRAGFRVWRDTKITPGEDWRKDIAEAIEQSFAVVFLMSRESVKSKYCKEEIYYALNRKVAIFPIVIEKNCFAELQGGMKMILQRIQWVDFTDPQKYETTMSVLSTILNQQQAKVKTRRPGTENEEEAWAGAYEWESTASPKAEAVQRGWPPAKKRRCTCCIRRFPMLKKEPSLGDLVEPGRIAQLKFLSNGPQARMNPSQQGLASKAPKPGLSPGRTPAFPPSVDEDKLRPLHDTPAPSSLAVHSGDTEVQKAVRFEDEARSFRKHSESECSDVELNGEKIHRITQDIVEEEDEEAARQETEAFDAAAVVHFVDSNKPTQIKQAVNVESSGSQPKRNANVSEESDSGESKSRTNEVPEVVVHIVTDNHASSNNDNDSNENRSGTSRSMQESHSSNGSKRPVALPLPPSQPSQPSPKSDVSQSQLDVQAPNAVGVALAKPEENVYVCFDVCSGEEEAIAKDVAVGLKGRGYNVYMSESPFNSRPLQRRSENESAEDDCYLRNTQHIEDSSLVIFLLSAGSFESSQCKDEIHYAHENEKSMIALVKGSSLNRDTLSGSMGMMLNKCPWVMLPQLDSVRAKELVYLELTSVVAVALLNLHRKGLGAVEERASGYLRTSALNNQVGFRRKRSVYSLPVVNAIQPGLQREKSGKTRAPEERRRDLRDMRDMRI